MNEKINMDKQIREKLEGFSVAPPPHVWGNIQGQMAAQQKKKRMAYIAWISAAAVVVFAFVAGWFFNEQSTEVLPALAEQEIVVPQNDENTTQELVLIDTENNENGLVAEINQTKTTADKQKTEAVYTKHSTAEELEIENTFVASVAEISYELLESIEAIFTTENEDVFLAERQEKQVDKITITAIDELLIAANTKTFQKEKTKESGWIVGAHVSPGYSSHSANHGEQYAQNMTYSGDNGTGNVGGGMSVQYKTSKRLRVESGVYYSQNGQSSKNTFDGLFSFGRSDDLMYSAPENIADADLSPSFSNSVQLNNNGIEMNSTAGVINMQTTPKGAEVATNVELSGAKYANTLTTNGEFSQVFEFVEVPLYLRYSLLDKKFGIEVMGGINAGFIVGNNAYIDNDYGKQNIGSTEDISTVNLSGTVGLGVNYMLGKHFSLALEPRLNYYLNSINSNPDVDYRPYRVGFFTGVYYEF